LQNPFALISPPAPSQLPLPTQPPFFYPQTPSLAPPLLSQQQQQMPELLVHQKLQQEQERQQLEKERQQREQEAQHARSVECVMGAIDTRHHELLEELLALDEWIEEELFEFFWHAAVDALNGPALQARVPACLRHAVLRLDALCCAAFV
jgi:hypothetical protein